MFWDFLSLTPESIHQVTILFSDRGTPRTYRHMNGYSSHTYMWYNEKGEYCWVKYHFKTEQGIQNFTARGSGAHARRRPRLRHPRPATRRSRAASIPSWRVEVQIMTAGAGQRLPLRPLRHHQGLAARRLPAHRRRPPGPQPQPGELLRRGGAGGLLARQLRPRHRPVPGQDAAGAPVQLPRHPPPPARPQLPPAAGQRPQGVPDATAISGTAPCASTTTAGAARTTGRTASAARTPTRHVAVPPIDVAGMAARHAYELGDVDFVQAGDLYRKVMTDKDREHLVGNIVAHLGGRAEAHPAPPDRPLLQGGPGVWRARRQGARPERRRRSGGWPRCRRRSASKRLPCDCFPRFLILWHSLSPISMPNSNRHPNWRTFSAASPKADHPVSTIMATSLIQPFAGGERQWSRGFFQSGDYRIS